MIPDLSRLVLRAVLQKHQSIEELQQQILSIRIIVKKRFQIRSENLLPGAWFTQEEAGDKH